MAKEVGDVEIIIRGTKTGGPTEIHYQYKTQESSDTSLRSGNQGITVESPDFTKKVHDVPESGELWTDAIAAIETAEGIS